MKPVILGLFLCMSGGIAHADDRDKILDLRMHIEDVLKQDLKNEPSDKAMILIESALFMVIKDLNGMSPGVQGVVLRMLK